MVVANELVYSTTVGDILSTFWTLHTVPICYFDYYFWYCIAKNDVNSNGRQDCTSDCSVELQWYVGQFVGYDRPLCSLL